jgi:nitroimidazol reductase NimA-like FMN-containing flavoprotein (pyridoxamine 5'-phosphate oxidase superfamily)
MEQSARDFILDILDQCHDLALATIRPDGYPQATTVSYAHDGLTIYIGVGRDSQKAANIRACDKVSFTVTAPYADWSQIRGLSAAASARILDRPEDIERAGACLLKRFPQVAQWADAARSGAVALVEIRPRLLSLLDYRKGFGHTELVEA